MNSFSYVFLVLLFSSIDLLMTYVYIKEYKIWQPNKPYTSIEKNPLLTFLFSKVGFTGGMLFGAITILFLNGLMAFYAPLWFVYILSVLIVLAMINHSRNFSLLEKLMKKYPSGYLPKETFGEVEGNNLNKQEVKK